MVPRIQINLSAPGVSHLIFTQFGLKLVAAAAIALTASFWWLGTTLHQNIDEIENQMATIHTSNGQLVAEAKVLGLDLSDQAIRGIPQQVLFVKQVRERVGFSWTQLLTDLESAVPQNIMMRSISLDEKTDMVLLNGTAQSLQGLNRLIHQLENHPAFQDVILSQHANTKKKKAGRSLIVFSMKVFYNPT